MDEKTIYKQKMAAELKLMQADIDRLVAKAEKKDAEARKDVADQIEELKSKRDDARDRLQELEDAASDAWRDVKDGVHAAWLDLGSAIRSAKRRLD